MRKVTSVVAGIVAILACQPLRAEVSEITISRGDGVGFLPLMVMEKEKLLEKKAQQAGQKLAVKWVNISGSGAANDALLSGSAHFISGGVPGMLTLWDRTKGKRDVIGVASISSQPMYLNTKAAHLKSLNDLAPNDKIAVTGIKISIPSIIMQMYAREKMGPSETFRYDPQTVAMKHPDGVIALLSGSAGVTAHYTSPPFHQRERKDPAVRTIQTTNDVMGGSTTFAMMVTTKKFRDDNPKTFRIMFDAIKEAQEFIKAEPTKAAEALLESMGGHGWAIPELVEVLRDPDIKFDVTPENIMKYANFMADIGSIRNRLEKWSDLFGDEVLAYRGN